MIRSLAAAVILMATLGSGSVAASDDVTRRVVSFDQLDGWADDTHGAAFTAFLETCDLIKGPDWQAVCALAKTHSASQARRFFELLFRPLLIENGADAMFTGYFEPELNGSRTRTSRYRYPLHRRPPEARNVTTWKTRRQIMTSGVMDNRQLEIVWVDDPVDKFFLQIQGSGRVRLAEGGTIRVGYGGANGHDYRSIGQELVRRGVYEPHQVSAAVIRNWVKRNPIDGQELLYHNQSYVFFREVDVHPDLGPLGAMIRSISPMRSVAVDPAFVPLGAPVWLEKDGENPMRQLMVAQDTGSAIKGAQRADIFFGTGDQAGAAAGRLRDPGRMVVLMPIQRAYAMETGDR
jgi:membrane-bound lytic murein transglycosylase A